MSLRTRKIENLLSSGVGMSLADCADDGVSVRCESSEVLRSKGTPVDLSGQLSNLLSC